MNDDERRATAFHEAGHAVCAHELGRSVVHVSVIANEDAGTAGHVAHRRRSAREQGAWEEAVMNASYGDIPAAWRRRFEREIMISAAGEVAATKAFGVDIGRRGIGVVDLDRETAARLSSKFGQEVTGLITGGDARAAADLALRISGSEEEAAAYHAWLHERTRTLLNEAYVWPKVEAVALALLERKQLSGREAVAVMMATLKPLPGYRLPAFRSLDD